MPAPVSTSATPARGKPRSTTTRKATPRKAATGKTAVKADTAKPVKIKKPKLVRDSFTIPKDEYEALAELKQRCAKIGHPAKKSELMRAGIQALVALSDKGLVAALGKVPSLKTGRPKKA
ncbi:MAG: hypothetical protein Q8R72_01735 [Hylemonella sp.]|nr:hypothetical protein [Hylemonella sp.]